MVFACGFREKVWPKEWSGNESVRFKYRSFSSPLFLSVNNCRIRRGVCMHACMRARDRWCGGIVRHVRTCAPRVAGRCLGLCARTCYYIVNKLTVIFSPTATWLKIFLLENHFVKSLFYLCLTSTCLICPNSTKKHIYLEEFRYNLHDTQISKDPKILLWPRCEKLIIFTTRWKPKSLSSFFLAKTNLHGNEPKFSATTLFSTSAQTCATALLKK